MVTWRFGLWPSSGVCLSVCLSPDEGSVVKMCAKRIDLWQCCTLTPLYTCMSVCLSVCLSRGEFARLWLYTVGLSPSELSTHLHVYSLMSVCLSAWLLSAYTVQGLHHSNITVCMGLPGQASWLMALWQHPLPILTRNPMACLSSRFLSWLELRPRVPRLSFQIPPAIFYLTV